MPLCMVENCHSNWRIKELSFHTIPKQNNEAWLKALHLNPKNWMWNKNKKVCSIHFEEKWFDRTGQVVRLREGAVPSLHLSVDEKSTESASSVELEDVEEQKEAAGIKKQALNIELAIKIMPSTSLMEAAALEKSTTDPLQRIQSSSGDMEPITSNRNDGHYFAYNNYLYLKQKQMDGTVYYRCRHRHCIARAISRLHEEPQLVNQHNHLNERQEIEKLRFKQILRQRAATEDKDFKEIYMEEKAKNEEIARKIPFCSSVRLIMSRARMMEMPPTPRSLFDIHQAMQETQHYERFGKELGSEGEPFYGGYIQVDEDESVVFWLSPTVCDFIQHGGTKQVYLHAESTSSIVPSVGGPKHLFTVLIELENAIYPIIFALMDKKTVASYCAVLSQISDDIFAYSQIEVMSVMVDYEKVIREAVQQIFPKANVCGSWFHFARAILKKGNQLGIVNSKMVYIPVAVEEGIRMVLTLPLLPNKQFEKAVNKIQHLISVNDVELKNAFSLFCNYLIENWKQHEIAVQHLRNGVEPFHVFLLQTIPIGNRPQSIWTFIKHLQKIEQIKASAILGTHQTDTQPKRATILAETIRRAETMLNTDGDLLNFLRTVSHMMWRPSEIFEAEEKQDEDDAKVKHEEEMVTEMDEELVIISEDVEDETMKDFKMEEVNILAPEQNCSLNVQLNQRLCFHCRLEVATCAYIPCGHLSVCQNCQQDMLKQKILRNCPVCGEVSEMIVFIH